MICKYCSADIPEASIFCCICGRKQDLGLPRKTKHRANGDGSVYRQNNGWTAAITVGYTDEGKRIVRRKYGFASRKEALDYLPQLRNAPAPRQPLLVGDLWNTFLTTQWPKLAGNTKRRYNTAARRLDPLFEYRITDITIDDWQDVVSSAVSTHYPAKDMRDLISWFYKLAIAQQEVSANLAPFILLPDLEERTPVPFCREEILSFWNAWSQGYTISGYVLLMIYSGMMPGELLRTSKSMIDINAQTITGAGLKTKKRKTTPIVLADVLMPVVSQLMKSSRGLMLWDQSRDKFYSEYWACINLCGTRKLPPYACRHTTATALALTNVSAEKIKEVMRHSNISTTQRYIHISSESSLSTVNQLMDKAANK